MTYVYDRDLGTGRDGPVRAGVPDRLGAHPVAVRLLPLDADGLVHLRRHAEALAVVGHPNLGLIEDVTRIDDDTVLVATTLGTDTLGDRLGHRAFDTDEVVATIRAVAGALAAAHRSGLAHGAVHPGNVVWSSEPAIDRPAGVPVLVDLGLGRFRGSLVLETAPTAWSADRRAMLDMARTLVAVLGAPTTTRAAALAALVGDGGEDIVADPDGLVALVRECERIARRPDRPLPVEQPAPATPESSPPRHDSGPSPRRRLGARDRPAPGRGSRQSHDRRPVLAGAALAAGLIVGVSANLALHRGPGADEATRAAYHPPSDCGPESATPTPPPGAEVIPGFVDLDADGCADPLWWSPGDATLHVPTDPATGDAPDRFRLGAPGDLLVVGDWDCDGTSTPAIYRPESGQTFHFDRWATVDQPVDATPGEILAPESVPHTDGDDDGCDRIVVTSAGPS